MNAQQHWERGLEHWQACRFEEACREYTRAIALLPDFAPAYTGRGYVHHVNGDCQMAIADFTKAIELAPGDADAWKGRADCRYLIGDFGASIADYDEAIGLHPHVADYFHSRANAHSAVGNVQLAVEDYRRAISLDPRNPVSHYFLAGLLAKQNDFGGAIHHYQESISIDPDNLDSFVYGFYAWILATCPDERHRDGESAVKMATTACDLDEWAEESNIGILAAAHAANGNFDEAVKWQRRACELAADDRKTLQAQRLELYNSGKPLITSAER